MKLKMSFLNIEDEEFLINVNGFDYRVDSVSREFTVEIFNSGVYEISITQVKEKIFPKGFGLMLSIITLLVQGIFNVLTINFNNGSEDKIKPFLILSKAQVNVEKNMVIDFNFKYQSMKGFLVPVLTCKDIIITETKYSIYWNAFKDYFYNYSQKIVSVVLVWVCLMLLLMIEMIKIENIIATCICLALSIGFISLMVLLILRRFNSKKLLQYEFIQLLKREQLDIVNTNTGDG